METLVQDIRYALITMRRNPGFTAAGLITLALGIGATTAVFSVVDGVLLRPLPYPGADRLVRLWEEHPGGVASTGQRWLSNRTFHAWAEQSRTVDALGAYGTYEYTVGFDDEPARLIGSEISPGLLSVLGARPAVGRFFSLDESTAGADRVAVLSDRLWRERYAADPAIIGRSLVVDGQPYTIVGVASPGFYFPDRRPLFWMPYVVPRVSTDPAQSGRTAVFTSLGLLKPGVTPAQAEAEGTAAARTVPRPLSTELFFGKGGPVLVHARRLADDMTATVRPALLVLAAAVALVLLIACANVANLYLSRGVARQRELALRAAIGAGRGRLARQLLTESVVLAIAGGLAGLALAWALVRVLPALAPARFPRLDDVQLDAGVMTFAALASILSALISGLAPAVRGARVDLSESLRGGDGSSAGGFRGLPARRLRDGLLVVESAFAVMLLVGAGLLAHSFVRLTHVDAGYDAHHVLTARVQMPRSAPPERTGELIDGVLARLRATPGVMAAGAGSMMPMLSMTAISSFTLPAHAGGGKPTLTRSLTYVITPGYAEALGLRLREGRFFTERDLAGGPRAMIVNAEFVRQYLSSGPVAGRRFADLYMGDKGITTEIVGVVGNVLKDGNDQRPQPEIYFVHGSPPRQIRAFVNIVVRAAGDPMALSGTLRNLVRDVDRAAVVTHVDPLADLVAASVDQPRFAMAVLGAFAVLALTLASVGLYGVLSYTVSQRRRELGVRAALGAERAHLVALVLREGLAVTLVGLAVGLAAAAGLTRLMARILFGVTPLDAFAFGAAPVLLVLVAVAACLPPAFRAASIDPAIALRD